MHLAGRAPKLRRCLQLRPEHGRADAGLIYHRDNKFILVHTQHNEARSAGAYNIRTAVKSMHTQHSVRNKSVGRAKCTPTHTEKTQNTEGCAINALVV